MVIDYKHNALESLYKAYKKAVSNRYTVGIMEFEERIVSPNCDNTTLKVHWIKDGYKKGWFADPFILRVDENEFVLLVEEFVYKLNRGVISQLHIDRNDYSIKGVKTILDTGTHLSFPAYYRKNGRVYIYPESAERGATFLYEYDEYACRTTEVCMINPNKVADTIIVDCPKYFFEEGIFQWATTSPHFSKNELDIYKFSETGCSPILKPIKTIKTDRMTARNAGMVFEVNERLYRPAQDCTCKYGECTEIQEIVKEKGGIELRPVNRLYSSNSQYPDAFHTFNVFQNRYVAVDARKKRFPILAKIFGK